MGEVEASLGIVMLLSTYYVIYHVVGDFVDMFWEYYSRGDVDDSF